MSDIVKAVLVFYYKVETEYRFDFKNDSYSYAGLYTAGKRYSSSYRNIKTSGWYSSFKDNNNKYSHYFKIKNYKMI